MTLHDINKRKAARNKIQRTLESLLLNVPDAHYTKNLITALLSTAFPKEVIGKKPRNSELDPLIYLDFARKCIRTTTCPAIGNFKIDQIEKNTKFTRESTQPIKLSTAAIKAEIEGRPRIALPPQESRHAAPPAAITPPVHPPRSPAPQPLRRRVNAQDQSIENHIKRMQKARKK